MVLLLLLVLVFVLASAFANDERGARWGKGSSFNLLVQRVVLLGTVVSSARAPMHRDGSFRVGCSQLFQLVDGGDCRIAGAYGSSSLVQIPSSIFNHVV